MNETIAHLAKSCAFDAAHYTWIYVDRGKLTTMPVAALEDKLLAHGDYAAPLKTREIKQPFENMAVVVGFDKIGTINDSAMLFTFDCRDSFLYEAKMWSPHKGSSVNVMTIHFKAKPEQFKDVPPATAEHNPKGKSVDQLVLVSITPSLPDAAKKGLVDSIIPIMKLLALYIPCASAGLMQGERLDYYRPSNMGNNEKRKKKGKSALYEWKTVTLELKRPELPSAPKGGTHASPRLHQRRGHWVTSKLGKRFWRSEAVVGKAENGMLFHDYKTTE